ncbi:MULTISPECIES: DNA cytosine methyltransferase [Halomonadaceae]|uniref:DNA (cytosine-5-)-methyltransferase n=1 Tax=Vreelandella hamiltonii TaxID=502829 RepID=A0A8H9LU72_9GAMM|nr:MULTISPECIES: DNA cytosine methyltransferase [Halomonas]GGW38164.1 cytosine-specific methyltransferase [Halomonas hamiltonii]
MGTHISIDDAATILGISPQYTRRLCRQQILKAERIGNTWAVDSESVTRYKTRTGHAVAEDHPAYIDASADPNKPIALSFFSGAMGFDLGIEKAGFDIRLACEFDKYCRETILLNRPNTALLGDINAYSASQITEAAQVDIGSIDLMIGGPPCQAFSTAGKRKAFNDDRGNAFLTFINLAIKLKPRYLVIENVRGLLSCPMDHRPHSQRGPGFPDLSLDEMKGGALNFILCLLKKAGYACTFNLYNSANFGTPQTRERVIIVCSRDGNAAPFLQPTHSHEGTHGLPKWKTFREAVAGLKSHTHLNFPEKRLKYYQQIKAGQNWRSLPTSMQKEALGKSFFSGGGKTGFLRRLSWDKPAPTLVTHPAMPATDLAHPEENRPLSIEEYKRVQEFPDSWQIAGPLVQQYKQIGNAVPTSLGYAVGILIKNLLDDKATLPPDDFKFSRYRETSHYEWRQAFERQQETTLSLF